MGRILYPRNKKQSKKTLHRWMIEYTWEIRKLNTHNLTVTTQEQVFVRYYRTKTVALIMGYARAYVFINPNAKLIKVELFDTSGWVKKDRHNETNS